MPSLSDRTNLDAAGTDNSTDSDSDGVEKLLPSMSDMSITTDREGETRTEPQQVLPVAAGGRTTPQHAQRRPFDDVRDAGPAEDPIRFPPPQYYSARRAERVVCYNEITGEHFFATDVLFRVQGQDEGDSDLSLSLVERAYWRMPDKLPIETRMGHLEKCHVLKRLPRSEDSDNEEDRDEEDEDVLFLLTDECVAIKVNYRERMEQLLCGQPQHGGENPLVEIAALQLVGTDHPNVLGCHEVLFDEEYLSVVMPYCDGGDLHDAVAHQRSGLPEAEARNWFQQFLEGLRHLQAMGLCHRDLSPENIIINADRALIIDMGMCLRVPYSSSSAGGEVVPATTQGMHRRLIKPQGQVGKLPYMSPEVFKNRDAFDGFAIDLWTAGTILFFLLTGTKYEQPFDVVFDAMTTDLAGLLTHWGINLSADAIDLVQGLIQVDPRLRLTLDEALNHRWLRSGTTVSAFNES